MKSNATAFLIKIKLRHSLGKPSRSDFVQSEFVKIILWKLVFHLIPLLKKNAKNFWSNEETASGNNIGGEISAEGSMQSDMILGAVQFVILLAYFLYMLHQRRWEGKDIL